MSGKHEPKLIEVTLVKRHTHAGVEYAPGTKIHVDEPTAKWLADHRIINVNAAPIAAKEGVK